MREKINTAYFLDDPRKFDSIEEAEKELRAYPEISDERE